MCYYLYINLYFVLSEDITFTRVFPIPIKQNLISPSHYELLIQPSNKECNNMRIVFLTQTEIIKT